MTDPVVKTVEVPCSAARAFDVFVRNTAKWWPLDRHSVSAGAGKAARDITIDPHVGGAIRETTHEGNISEWGRVLEFAEGKAFAMTWHPGNPASLATHLRLEFIQLAPDRTRVVLTHSGWEVLAGDADERRNGYNSGWNGVLDVFEKAAA